MDEACGTFGCSWDCGEATPRHIHSLVSPKISPRETSTFALYYSEPVDRPYTVTNRILG